MQTKIWRYLRNIVFVVPFLFGTIGLVLEGESLPDGMFHAVTMYVLNFGGEPGNWLVELARWTAPLMTASGIVLLVKSARLWLKAVIRYQRGESIAVYGPEDVVEPFCDKDRTRCFYAGSLSQGAEGSEEARFTRAHRYILLGKEEENFAFVRKYKAALQDRKIYLQTASLRSLDADDDNIKLFSLEETAARLFWKEQMRAEGTRPSLYEEVMQTISPGWMAQEGSGGQRYSSIGITACYSPGRMMQETSGELGNREIQDQQEGDVPHVYRIVVLGWNRLAEEVVTRGLQMIIFRPTQRIEYHIIGEAGDFFQTHQQMEKITDPVIFHSGQWYDNDAILKSAHKILICVQEDQTALVRRLMMAYPQKTFTIFAAADLFAAYPLAQQHLVIFPWQEKAATPGLIMEDELLALARRINLRYAHIYNGVEETKEEAIRQWKRLSRFKKYSNISSADYHEIQLAMMQEEGWTVEDLTEAKQTARADAAAAGNTEMPAGRLDLLAHLEHIRWCREHYLGNWQYGIPKNGGTGDEELLIHKDLVPYETLSEAEKEKDRENIRLLMGV